MHSLTLFFKTLAGKTSKRSLVFCFGPHHLCIMFASSLHPFTETYIPSQPPITAFPPHSGNTSYDCSMTVLPSLSKILFTFHWKPEWSNSDIHPSPQKINFQPTYPLIDMSRFEFVIQTVTKGNSLPFPKTHYSGLRNRLCLFYPPSHSIEPLA